ncbi:MAG TPA: hypothetical protein DIT64_14370 [Verrucomicrobiales bacterium]|nr:hypothetical protein [Verrucomicrobiales bacterium]
MRIWFQALLWLVMIGLQWRVCQTCAAGSCSVGMVDPGGPIWHVNANQEHMPIHALLLFSPMVLMPLGRRLFGGSSSGQTPWIEIFAALCLGLSLLFRPVDPRVVFEDDSISRRVVPAGFFLALPWLAVRSWSGVVVLRRWRHEGFGGLGHACVALAQVFPAIGAAWLVAHRANWTPWNFDPLIVLLTAAHFHHAGLTLPLIAGLNARANPGRLTSASCAAVLAGVPLVAAGITCAHFGMLPLLEPLGVMVLVAGAMGVAASQLLTGVASRGGMRWRTRAAFLFSGACLIVAMILALSFGLRYLFPRLALTMPQMWMIHGSLNTFGFGLCGILAWRSLAGRGQSAG